MAIRHHGNGNPGSPPGNGSGPRPSQGGNGHFGELARQIRALAHEFREFREEQSRRWEEQREINMSVRESLQDIIRHVTSLHLSLEESNQRQRQFNRLFIRELQTLRRGRN